MDINRRAQTALNTERLNSFSILPEMRHGLKVCVVKSLFRQTMLQLERLVHACFLERNPIIICILRQARLLRTVKSFDAMIP